MAFFNQFPTVNYDFNRTGTIQQMVNIFRSVRQQSSLLNDATLYKKYYIRNGMRPDIVSEQLYGTPDFYWTLFIINDFLHDGLQAWPMSEEILQDHIKKNYAGKVLQFTPTTLTLPGQTAKITKNSIAGKLNLGAKVFGVRSGAVGIILRKDIDLNLIVLSDPLLGVENRNPITGEFDDNIEGGDFFTGEFLQSTYIDAEGVTRTLTTGADNANTLSPDFVYEYEDAPAFYFLESDEEEKAITSPDILPTEISQVTPIFSELQWNKNLQSEIVGFDKSLINNNDLGDDSFYATNVSSSEPLIYSGGYQTIGSDEGSNITFKTNRQFVRDKNDARSNINVINPAFINEFVEEFERVLNA